MVVAGRKLCVEPVSKRATRFSPRIVTGRSIVRSWRIPARAWSETTKAVAGAVVVAGSGGAGGSASVSASKSSTVSK
jgi:hypothetical protein